MHAGEILGDRRALRSIDIDELAPDVRHSGDFPDRAGAVEVLEAGIAVGTLACIHPRKQARWSFWMLPFPVAREAIPCRRRRARDPQGRSSRAWVKSRAVCVVPVPSASKRMGLSSAKIAAPASTCRTMAENGVGLRLQQRSGLADPVAERRAVEVQPVALEDSTLISGHPQLVLSLRVRRRSCLGISAPPRHQPVDLARQNPPQPTGFAVIWRCPRWTEGARGWSVLRDEVHDLGLLHEMLGREPPVDTCGYKDAGVAEILRNPLHRATGRNHVDGSCVPQDVR
jgi:hypothetical protein